MKLHPRTLDVQRVAAEVGARVSTTPGIEELTPLELAGILADLSRRWLTYALRDERHPDAPGKKADEA